VQAAVAHGVLDAVRAGYIPKERAESLGIIASIWLDPSVVDAPDLDHELLFRTQREAMTKALRKAMAGEPSIDWLLEHQHEVTHYYHQLGVDGQL
jgi:formaldehyde-activating enzyme